MKELWNQYKSLPVGVRAAIIWLALLYVVLLVTVPVVAIIVGGGVGTFLAINRLIGYSVWKK